ncbi:MAG: pyruvate kinase [Candidatus Aminicenantia bacterium]
MRLEPKTKIIATIGPSSLEEDILTEMLKNGMKVARINFSHGNREFQKEAIEKVRKVSEELDIPVSILADLQGPRLRVGNIKEPITLKENEIIEIFEIGKGGLEIPLSLIFNDIKIGDKILFDEGKIKISIIEKGKERLKGKVIQGGILKPRKGINLPDTELSLPSITEKDIEDIKFAIEHGIDLIALSFVKDGKDSDEVRKILKNNEIPIVAKVERPVAYKNIDSIVENFDGVMVARGDLGVEMDIEMIPILQKEIIKIANQKGKLIITATQMLESMIENPLPTRAESTDIANSILDGTDALMLSGETAVGKYPSKAVEFMAKIAITTERKLTLSSYYYPQEQTPALSISCASVNVAKDINAKLIMVFSVSGATAITISKMRPTCPIVAFTPYESVRRKLSIYWGIFPLILPANLGTDEMIETGERILREKGLVEKGDTIVIVAGKTPSKGTTNMLKVERIG